MLAAESQNLPAKQDDDLIPRVLPDLGPRISLEAILSNIVDSSNSAIVSIHIGSRPGSQAGLQGGLLAGLHGGSLAGLHIGSLAGLHGGSLAGLHGGSLAGLHGGSNARPKPQTNSMPQPDSLGTSKTPVRLPTPADGCGISPVKKSRIVGGVPAKNGAWPWMALLGGLQLFSIFIMYSL